MTIHPHLKFMPAGAAQPATGPSSPLVSLTKTVTWRLVAAVDTFAISYLITGSFSWAGSIVGIEVVSKMGLYYAHERAWCRLPAAWARLERMGRMTAARV